MKRTRRVFIIPLCIVSALTLTFAGRAAAQNQSGEIRGQLTDERGAVIVGAKLTLVAAGGEERTATTNREGVYTFRSLAYGAYILRAAAEGFGIYENTEIQLTPGQTYTLDVQLKVALTQESVTVSSEAALNTEPENNVDSLRLRGKQLDILPNDSDDLAAALQALAGPAAGPNGGEILVDGFSGARLPPKSSIREVRINQNPFSAEFDRVGYGRIEIFTKPGTGDIEGEAVFNFNDESLNARNPYVTERAPYQVRSLEFSASGPIIKKRLSFFLGYENRGVDDNAYINALTLDPLLNVMPFIQTTATPRRLQEREPRLDWQISKNHTLSAVVEFNPSHTHNTGIGVALQRLFSSAKALRGHFAMRRSRTAKRQTSPVLAHHFRLIF